MGCRRWVWRRNISPSDSHVHTAMRVVKLKLDSAGRLFVWSFGLFVSCTSSLCTYFCSSITPFLFPTLFFLLFSWNEAICHKYAHTVYRAYCNTYAGLYAERDCVSQFLSNIFVNMLQPGVCWMMLVTNILFHSHMAESISAVLFWFMFHSTKNVVCDRQRAGDALGGDSWGGCSTLWTNFKARISWSEAKFHMVVR